MNFPNRKSVTLHGTSARRKKLLKTDADFYIINHDGFNIISEDALNMFDLVIVDEVAVLRNPSTNRFKALRKFMDKHPRTCLLYTSPSPRDGLLSRMPSSA